MIVNNLKEDFICIVDFLLQETSEGHEILPIVLTVDLKDLMLPRP